MSWALITVVDVDVKIIQLEIVEINFYKISRIYLYSVFEKEIYFITTSDRVYTVFHSTKLTFLQLGTADVYLNFLPLCY